MPDCVLIEQYFPIFQVLLAVQQSLQVTIKLEQTNRRTVNQSIQQEMNYQGIQESDLRQETMQQWKFAIMFPFFPHNKQQ